MNEEELRKLISKYNPYHKSVDDRVVEVSKYLNLNLDSNSLVLDAGCGEGEWSKLCNYIKGEIVGTDIIAEDLRRNRNVKFRVCGTIESLPYKDNLFDLIICEWVVEHLNNPEAVLKEFYRVLKPGGYLFILTSNILNPVMLLGGKLFPYRLTQKLHKILYSIKEEDVFPLRYKFNTLKIIDQTLTLMGFEKVLLTTVNNPWYLKFNKVLCLGYILFERICAKLGFRFLDQLISALYRKKDEYA